MGERVTAWVRRLTPSRALVVLGVCALALSLAAPSVSAAAKKRKPRSMYWGAWIGKQLTGTEAPTDMNAVYAFQNMVGKPLSLVEWAVPFADCNYSPCNYFPFPAENMQKVRDYGAIPFLSWSSASIPNDVNEPDFQLSDVISGRYDAYIGAWAQQARDWGHPFFLRFNWEMNGDWFPWSERTNGNQYGEYVVAWRHVHEIFDAYGVSNATWVWCPLVDRQNSVPLLRHYYPGDTYVDWTCLDGYNWGANPANPAPWKSFDKIFRKDYRRIVRKVAPGKPMVLAELGSNSAGGNKARWIRKMFKILPLDYRRVRGLIWFDVVDRNIDWPLETSPPAAAAFGRGVRKFNFWANSFGGLPFGKIPAPPPRP